MSRVSLVRVEEEERARQEDCCERCFLLFVLDSPWRKLIFSLLFIHFAALLCKRPTSAGLQRELGGFVCQLPHFTLLKSCGTWTFNLHCCIRPTMESILICDKIEETAMYSFVIAFYLFTTISMYVYSSQWGALN